MTDVDAVAPEGESGVTLEPRAKLTFDAASGSTRSAQPSVAVATTKAIDAVAAQTLFIRKLVTFLLLPSTTSPTNSESHLLSPMA
jgi:hypothetical protein